MSTDPHADVHYDHHNVQGIGEKSSDCYTSKFHVLSHDDAQTATLFHGISFKSSLASTTSSNDDVLCRGSVTSLTTATLFHVISFKSFRVLTERSMSKSSRV